MQETIRSGETEELRQGGGIHLTHRAQAKAALGCHLAEQLSDGTRLKYREIPG
jgi:hypothetical protein